MVLLIVFEFLCQGGLIKSLNSICSDLALVFFLISGVPSSLSLPGPHSATLAGKEHKHCLTKGVFGVFTVSGRQLSWEERGAVVRWSECCLFLWRPAWVSCNPQAWKPGLSSSWSGIIKECWLEGDTSSRPS